MAKSTKPKKPKLTPEERKARRQANRSAMYQFAALGLFIQRFERIVGTLRSECARIVRGGRHGIGIDARAMMAHWNICTLAFHHEAVTARPVLEMWRALTFEECRALVLLSVLSESASKIITEITTELNNEFEKFIPKRNHLIHATWNIGLWVPGQDLTSLIVEKHKVTKEGFQQRDDLPRSFDELMALSENLANLWERLGRFLQFFQFQPEQIEHVFKKDKGRWAFIPPAAADRTPLRKKLQ